MPPPFLRGVAPALAPAPIPLLRGVADTPAPTPPIRGVLAAAVCTIFSAFCLSILTRQLPVKTGQGGRTDCSLCLAISASSSVRFEKSRLAFARARASKFLSRMEKKTDPSSASQYGSTDVTHIMYSEEVSMYNQTLSFADLRFDVRTTTSLSASLARTRSGTTHVRGRQRNLACNPARTGH